MYAQGYRDALNNKSPRKGDSEYMRGYDRGRKALYGN